MNQTLVVVSSEMYEKRTPGQQASLFPNVKGTLKRFQNKLKTSNLVLFVNLSHNGNSATAVLQE